jgi:predicted transcriptional regulator
MSEILIFLLISGNTHHVMASKREGNRSKIHLLYLLLISIIERGECNQTAMLSGAMMSYQQVTLYLNRITGNGLARINNDKDIYAITPKGLQFVRAYPRLMQPMSPQLETSDVAAI